MTGVITKEWVFTVAQTDLAILTASATQQYAVTYLGATCANSNTGDVALRVGFATATLPTITNDSATGSGGVFFSHGGIARGGGAVAANGGAVLAVGAADEDVRLTCSAATGGSLRVVLSYALITIEA